MKLSELKSIIMECLEEREYHTAPPLKGFNRSEPMAHKKKSLSGKIVGGIRKIEKKVGKIKESDELFFEGGGTRKNRRLRGQSPAHTDTRGYAPSDGGTSRSHKIFAGSDYLKDREKEGLEAMSVRHSAEITKNSLEKRRRDRGKPSTGYTKGGASTSTIKPFTPSGSFKRLPK